MTAAGALLIALVAMAARHHLKLASQLRERSAAKQSLSFEFSELSAAVEQSAASVMITDRTGVIEYVNPAFCRLTGTASITPIRDETGEISHFMSVKEHVTERKLQLEKLEQLAHYDTLTGLPNRALFFDRFRCLEALSRREGKGLALLYIDLDGFKQVNNSYGHEAGDAVLRTVAERLLACIRDSDTAARMSGDEFSVLLGDILQGSHAGPIARKVLQALSAPIILPDGIHCAIGVSIGISIYPEDGLNSEMLVNAADSAMLEVKGEGQGGYRFYGETQSPAKPGRTALTLCRKRG